MIDQLTPDVLFEFAALFESSSITHVYMHMYNGTPNGMQKFSENSYIYRRKFTISGKTMQEIVNILEQVEFSQIERMEISTGEYHDACILDAVERKLVMNSMDMLDMEVVKAFSKKHKIREVKFTI